MQARKWREKRGHRRLNGWYGHVHTYSDGHTTRDHLDLNDIFFFWQFNHFHEKLARTPIVKLLFHFPEQYSSQAVENQEKKLKILRRNQPCDAINFLLQNSKGRALSVHYSYPSTSRRQFSRYLWWCHLDQTRFHRFHLLGSHTVQ